jgi:hypothetical protein
VKLLFENWRKYLTEQEGSDMILYHVSSTPDIEVLDPAVAGRNLSNYSTAEYRAWDRPRVFYFTRLGQEDLGVGRMVGEHTYWTTVDRDKIYPIMDDPLKLSHRVDEYKEIREQEQGTPQYYPAKPWDVVATLGEREHGIEGFIYPQSGDPNNMIVALWAPKRVERLDEPFYKEAV